MRLSLRFVILLLLALSVRGSLAVPLTERICERISWHCTGLSAVAGGRP